jgi:Arc/MetJ family transcription regulator
MPAFKRESRLAEALAALAVGKLIPSRKGGQDFGCCGAPRYAAAPQVWFQWPYYYGKIECMKKTLNVDDRLFTEAKVACGATTDTETVRLGLEALVRHAAYERLRALRGAEPRARDVPRRREKPSLKRRVA